MRILHVDTGSEMRGGQHQVMLLMKALRSAGHEQVLLARHHGPLWCAAAGAGFEAHAATLGNVWKRSQAAEIVHAHDAHAHTLTAIASGRIFVVSRRVAFPIKRSLASRWKYKQASRFLAVSQFVAAQLQAAGVPASKVDIVPDAVERAAEPQPWNPTLPAVALASSDPQKGRSLIEEAARVSGVEVRFSNDLPHDLKRASMFVYITRSEGFGSAALLAMSMGVPVIASRIGGLTEVFEDGESGLLVNNEAPEIVRAMRRVLGNPALAQSLIEKGRKRIEEHFLPTRLLMQTVESYRKASAA